MVNWEYKTIEFDTSGWTGGKLDVKKFNEFLNNFGREGWELVNCFDTNQSHGASRNVIAVMKRQI